MVVGGLWDIPFQVQPTPLSPAESRIMGEPVQSIEPVWESKADQSLRFWERLSLEDLGGNAATGEDEAEAAIIRKGKRKVGEEGDIWQWGNGSGHQAVERSEEKSVDHVTRTGRVYQPVHLQGGSSSNPTAPAGRAPPIAIRTAADQPGEVPNYDSIQKQLERTPAPINAWGLITVSKLHRQKLQQALARLEVTDAISPEDFVALILPAPSKHSVTFTDKDLPVEGTAHNRPLHITVKVCGLWVPTVLIDNGSAINVCPLRVAYRLGFAKKDLAPSNLAVKAYDGTRRLVEGVLILRLDVEGFEMEVEFHVVDIPASFNLLLGRPWMHKPDIMAVPSTLHQKVLLGLGTGTLAILGDSGIRPHAEENAPVLGIAHGEEDRDFGGFSFDTSGSVLTIDMDDGFFISSTALEMMKKMSYMPGFGLGANQQGISEFPNFPSKSNRFGLGYTAPTSSDARRKGRRTPRTLQEKPTKEGDEDAYQGQAEMFWDAKTGKWLPGFEIFEADTWASSDEEQTDEGAVGAEI